MFTGGYWGGTRGAGIVKRQCNPHLEVAVFDVGDISYLKKFGFYGLVTLTECFAMVLVHYL